MAGRFNTVRTPLGGNFKFLNKEEKAYFENAFKEYLRRYHFEHPADLTALENLLVSQLLAYRYSKWATEGVDYDGNPVDANTALANLLNIQQKVSSLMTSLGISRREREENLSAQEIISRIARKAKEYGIHKNKVAWEFLIRSYKIRDVLDTYRRMDDIERKKFGYTEQDVIAKIEAILQPLEEMEEEFLRERNLWKPLLQGEIITTEDKDASGEAD